MRVFVFFCVCNFEPFCWFTLKIAMTAKSDGRRRHHRPQRLWRGENCSSRISGTFWKNKYKLKIWGRFVEDDDDE